LTGSARAGRRSEDEGNGQNQQKAEIYILKYTISEDRQD
jgi:hypothetical protein